MPKTTCVVYCEIMLVCVPIWYVLCVYGETKEDFKCPALSHFALFLETGPPPEAEAHHCAGSLASEFLGSSCLYSHGWGWKQGNLGLCAPAEGTLVHSAILLASAT